MTTYKIGGITSEIDRITLDSGEVKLGTDGSIPIRLPNFTNGEMTALTPSDGSAVYNTTSNAMFVRQNGAWTQSGSGGGGDLVLTDSKDLAGQSSVTLTVTGANNSAFILISEGVVMGTAGEYPAITFNNETDANYTFVNLANGAGNDLTSTGNDSAKLWWQNSPSTADILSANISIITAQNQPSAGNTAYSYVGNVGKYTPGGAAQTGSMMGRKLNTGASVQLTTIEFKVDVGVFTSGYVYVYTLALS